MDKTHLRTTMLALTEDALEHAKNKYTEYLRGARISRDDQIEAGAASQSELSADIAVAFDQPIHSNEEKLSHLAEIDFGPRKTVDEGAVVTFNGRHFIIAVATSEFTCQGESFMGISTQAPIFASLEGLQKGDAFTYGDQEFVIENVL